MKFRRDLEPLRPYKPPRMSLEAAAEHVGPGGGSEGSLNGYIKLTSNELSFGPLPEAETALRKALSRANRYPDRHASSLREAIVGANPEATPRNVLVGNGSSEILLNLLQLVTRPGEVLFPWPTFGLYKAISTVLGLAIRMVPLTGGYGLDPDALLSAVTGDTRAVILCNPNNPTGTYLELNRIRSFAEALPKGVLLILDEAYQEFVSDAAYRGSHTLALAMPNVAVVRTFSKAHGLAGLRVGYGIASERMADYAERVRFPFSVNLAAQAAGTASMLAHNKIQGRAETVMRERDRLQDAFGGHGLNYIPSQGNFVMVEAEPVIFEKAGVLVREAEALGGPKGWSRVTVGSTKENDRVLGALL